MEASNADTCTIKTSVHRSKRKREFHLHPEEEELHPEQLESSSRPKRKKTKTRPQSEHSLAEDEENHQDEVGVKKWKPQRDGCEKKKKHLIDAAYDILNDYFYNVSKHPDDDAREALAKQVRDIPGCEDYSSSQVYAYFGNMRFKKREGHVPKAMRHPREDGKLSAEWFEDMRTRQNTAENTQLSSSGRTAPPNESSCNASNLTVVSQLDVLLKTRPSPVYAEAARWATMVGGVDPKLILTYALMKNVSSTHRSRNSQGHAAKDSGGEEQISVEDLDGNTSYMGPLYIGH